MALNIDNMFKKSKVVTLCESLMSIYKASGLKTGDQIKLDNGIFSHEDFKNLPKEIQEKVKQMVEGDKNGDVIISVVGADFSSTDPDMKSAALEIGLNAGGQRFFNNVILPYSLIQFVDKVETGVNMPETIAPNSKVTYENDPTVVELDSTNLGKWQPNVVPSKQTDAKLPTTNTVLPNAENSVKTDYLKNIKKKVKIN